MRAIWFRMRSIFMIKPTIQQGYRNIRELIKKNVDTIIVLVDQAQNLEKIVNSINETGETEKELKTKLEAQIQKLRDTISNLVNQTDELFKSYDEMVETNLK